MSPRPATMPDHQQPAIIAHRGESHDAPENTLAAIDLAWKRGARAVEIDVRTSADGQLVVIHDSHTGRIGGPRRPVSGQTAAELRTLDAGRWKAPRWAGERIPFLREVLETVPSAGRLFIELKESAEVVPRLASLIAELPLAPDRLVVMSFDPATVAAADRSLPGVEVCQLLTADDWTAEPALPDRLAAAVERGCHSLNLEHHQKLNRAVIDAIHAAGLRAYVWTVNQPEAARRLRDAGVDGIATDRYAWMTKHLDAVLQHPEPDS